MDAAAPPRRSSADALDACLWLLVPLLVLGSIPIGFVSADGLGQSFRLSTGAWGWNPNHLLLEPLGAAWQRLWTALGSGRLAVDRLKLLSIAAGALAAALFRWSVAPRLATDRLAANHATAWLALSSAFARLWVSDEAHMIQMPWLVAFAALLLRHRESPSFGRAAAAGATAGGAALCFVSNLLLGAAAIGVLAAWHARRRALRTAALGAAGLAAGLAVVAGGGLGLAWLLTSPNAGFADWLLSYSGGGHPARVDLLYGMRWTPAGLLESAVRALYGAACAAVDLAPAVAAVRDGGSVSRATLIAAAAAAAAVALGAGGWRALRRPATPADQGTLLLNLTWWPAVLAFGLFWNDSDEQFYVQLAVAFGALAARQPRRRLLVALSCAALLGNAADVAGRRILYPRGERLALLEAEVRGAGLIVYPGFDEVEVLLSLAPWSAESDRLGMTHLVIEEGAAAAPDRVAGAVRATLAAGRRVELIDIYDTPPDRPPWRLLRRLGFDRGQLREALRELPVEPESRRAGPFTLRSIRP